MYACLAVNLSNNPCKQETSAQPAEGQVGHHLTITFQLISNIPGDNQPRRRSEPHGTPARVKVHRPPCRPPPPAAARAPRWRY